MRASNDFVVLIVEATQSAVVEGAYSRTARQDSCVQVLLSKTTSVLAFACAPLATRKIDEIELSNGTCWLSVLREEFHPRDDACHQRQLPRQISQRDDRAQKILIDDPLYKRI